MSKSFTANRPNEATQYGLELPPITLNLEKYASRFHQRASDLPEHTSGSQALSPAVTETSASQIDWGMQRPASWPKVTAAINSSREMIAWPDNWDGDGALPISVSTWERTVNFIARCAWRFWDLTHRDVPVPAIEPGRNGSINVEWELTNRYLLLNVSAADTAPFTFFGEDASHTDVIEGSINPASDAAWLLMWLTV